MDLPKRLNSNEVESKWVEFWKDKDIYKWNEGLDRDKNFVIDTPPPTVSGSLHLGHVFSYTQTDAIARYKRMSGFNVYYPMGFDDNGLPTERRVQNVFGIKCDTSLNFDENWIATPKKSKKDKDQLISRKNFMQTCFKQTAEDEKKYEHLWRHLGLSIDWNEIYATIDDHCRKTSQYSFLDLIEKDKAYNKESPCMWDVTFQTAVAQAELEDREVSGFSHDIRFGVSDENGQLTQDNFIISTTRPELLPACIAVVAHPDDERYKKYFGKYAITPLFKSKVPIMAAEHADPEKGTGILMVCTFGDQNDVDFWKQQDLPLKQILNRFGVLKDIDFGQEPFSSIDPVYANKNYANLKGLFVKKAKKQIVEMLKEKGSYLNDDFETALVGELQPTQQQVKYYEKGDLPIEFISTRQWYVDILSNKQELLGMADKIQWYPKFMKQRYLDWVDGINQDWCISRQRYFGVPFPLWYKIDNEGEVLYDSPIFADRSTLPIDPSIDIPPDYNESQRNQNNGFIADLDVMDTWATSSVTPQISSKWIDQPERHSKLFPADLRPQGHEIIRTWAFYTIVKSFYHEGKAPWKNIALSGWAVDRDRKKMSKSKGNVIEPQELINKYSADAVRYWALRFKLGTDTIYDEGIFKIGSRLTNKIFNASKFVHLQLFNKESIVDSHKLSVKDITDPLDLSWCIELKQLLVQMTKHLEGLDYAQSLMNLEQSFWGFCDHYLEIVKSRSYGNISEIGEISAKATLKFSVSQFLRLFALYLPYVTEEVWQWFFTSQDNKNSIMKSFNEVNSVHLTEWPKENEFYFLNESANENYYDIAKEVLSEIRSEKTKSQKSLKTQVATLIIKGNKDNLDLFSSIKDDIMTSGNVDADGLSLIIQDIKSEDEVKTFEIEVTL
jgi:valyl-tRNA synthetase